MTQTNVIVAECRTCYGLRGSGPLRLQVGTRREEWHRAAGHDVRVVEQVECLCTNMRAVKAQDSACLGLGRKGTPEIDRFPVGSIIIVRRYTGTMVAQVAGWRTPTTARVWLLMHRGWSRTERTVAAADILGSAGTQANLRQRAALALADKVAGAVPGKARDGAA